MIRIDEIYDNTFWPWISKNLPGYRMYMCDPFGRSDPDSVIGYGNENIHEHNYIFFFDQEPIHLNIHNATFDQVQQVRSDDIHSRFSNNVGAICTSEKNSDNVENVCKKYHWRSYYYFFHGWAALDWYRGYDRTFLIPPVQQRTPTKTFINPNRIVAGERAHRLEILYHIFKNQLTNNYISCPETCPAENVKTVDAAAQLIKKFPDVQEIFSRQSLPINFKNETGHPMHSCWLSLFDESADSLLYLVTETVASGHRLHLTEKTFKPIALGMPFVIVGTQGSLEYLRSYGFKTFGNIWDESYDCAGDDVRIQKIANLLSDLDKMSVHERQNLYRSAQNIIEHNWNHFYNGGFEKILWQELTGMLNDIKSHS
jgi:hypothetical protein